MKSLAILAIALLPSCTVLKYPNGKTAVMISSNARGVSFASSGGDIQFSADSLDNSGVIAAYGRAVTPVVTSWGAVQALKNAPAVVNSWTGNHPPVR
jgi:hypothetical protein